MSRNSKPHMICISNYAISFFPLLKNPAEAGLLLFGLIRPPSPFCLPDLR